MDRLVLQRRRMADDLDQAAGEPFGRLRLRTTLQNCEFVAADASAVFGTVPYGGAETAVIVDPPRKGCSDDFLRQLVAFAPRTVVYVSCNPETQARDLGTLRTAGYRCVRLLPFDMFPQTRHVEAVATLIRVATS